jgi:hypothetical protein
MRGKAPEVTRSASCTAGRVRNLWFQVSICLKESRMRFVLAVRVSTASRCAMMVEIVVTSANCSWSSATSSGRLKIDVSLNRRHRQFLTYFSVLTPLADHFFHSIVKVLQSMRCSSLLWQSRSMGQVQNSGTR